MTQETEASDNVWKGTLYYPRAGDGAVSLAAGAQVGFSFGTGGYSEVRVGAPLPTPLSPHADFVPAGALLQVVLFTLTPDFIAKWGLASVL
jgi:hypothetical protein